MSGRRFGLERMVGLSDVDPAGRIRLDAIAGYLQDVASADVIDAGWTPDEHFWVVRRTELHVVEPFCDDVHVQIETWASAIAPAAAARRYSLRGDRGGRLEAESVWIHLDGDLRPLRLGERFLAVYGTSAAGRRASTRLRLPAEPAGRRRPWPLRITDFDRLGHMNNAAYWAAAEEAWAGRLGGCIRAELEYRRPVDLGEAAELAVDGDLLWLVAGGEARSAARLDPEGARDPEQLP